MKVLTEVRFIATIEQSMPAEVTQRWTDGASRNAEIANNRRKAKIKNRGDYEAIITEISSRKYEPYINPDFVSKKGFNKDEIMAKHYKNNANGYTKYTNNLDYMYETVDGVPAKRYKEKIERTAAHYGNKNVARKVLGFSGMRSTGLGCSVQVIRWLDGESTIAKGTTVQIEQGGPMIIAQMSLRSSFRSVLEQRLNQAGAAVMRADFTAGEMKRQNDITNDLMNAMSNPGLNLVPFATGGDSRVDYIQDEAGILYVHVKVSQK
ncbi:MAG: hypothetical protein HY762_01785 [Planctomycetes bacterium]|nr:hypothetical protein [Planctomycetota bacterium]